MGGVSWKAIIPEVDKCGADISNLHGDGGPCSQEDDFRILIFFLYGKMHMKGSLLSVKWEPAFSPDMRKPQEGLGLHVANTLMEGPQSEGYRLSVEQMNFSGFSSRKLLQVTSVTKGPSLCLESACTSRGWCHLASAPTTRPAAPRFPGLWAQGQLQKGEAQLGLKSRAPDNSAAGAPSTASPI